jgi:TetR/AcrR family transcriptional repressor of nem operon
MVYWQKWVDTQASCDPEGKCLAVKLGAEVSDLSETMRKVLLRGTSAVIGRLARTIERGLADGSVVIAGEPQETAETLYQTWLGASLLADSTQRRTIAERACRQPAHTRDQPGDVGHFLLTITCFCLSLRRPV